MPGLLGDGWDDPRSAALMNLSAGLIRGDFGGGLLGANNAFQEHKQNAFKQKYMDMQVQNMQSEIESRRLKTIQDQRQQKLIESFFPGLLGGDATSASAPAGPGATPGGNDVLGLSQQLGVPPQAIQADLVFNGGKGIGDMLFKRGTPNMEVANGYAFDKNRVGPGYLPQLNIARDGQASMVQIGPDGLPVVSAPQGAYNTYAGYKGIEEGTRANFDPVTVTPQGQNPQMTTRGALVRNPQVSGRVTPQEQAGRDAERTTILQNEFSQAQQRYNAAIAARDQSAAARAQADMAALQRELGRAKPTLGLPLQSKEEEQRASLGVEGDAKLNAEMTAQASQSRDVVANINRARELLKLGPTASGFGSMVDKANSFVGQTTASANLASALDNVSGWLTSNVPRMEGPQSNMDVENYRIMAGRVGDRSLPVPQRLAALDELERMQKKYERFNGLNTGSTVPGQQQSQSQKLDTLPKTAPKGQRVRDTQTGEILVFNGMSWVKEK